MGQLLCRSHRSKKKLKANTLSHPILVRRSQTGVHFQARRCIHGADSAGDSLLTVSVLRNRTLLGVAGPLPLPQAEDPSGWLEARWMAGVCSQQLEKAETPSNEHHNAEDCVDERVHLDWLGSPHWVLIP